MKKIETDRRFEGSIDLAEVGKFTDAPVKHHFDGMAVRLASCCTESCQLPGGPDAHPGFCCDDELTSQSISILVQDSFHDTHPIAWIFVAKPKQHHTMMCLTPTKDEFAEVLVIRNQDSSLADSAGHNILIVGLRHHLSNGQHVMAESAQVFNDRGTGRLIDDEVHDGWYLGRHGEGKDILIGEDLGSVGQSSTDVVRLETRVFSQDVSLWNALGQHAHNKLDRNASPADDWLSNHDVGVHGDTLPMLLIH